MRRFPIIILCALLLTEFFEPCALARAEQCRKSVDAATEFGALSDPSQALAATGPTLLPLSRETGFDMRYAMLRLSISGERQGKWLLTIRDENFRALRLLTPKDFDDARSERTDGLWTGRLFASDIWFDLFVEDPRRSDVVIRIEEALTMPVNIEKEKARYSWKGSKPTYFSLYDEARLQLGLEEKRKLRRLGDNVGFVIGMTRPEPGKTMSWCCSGVMLTESLFLTNWHCGGWFDGLTETSVWSQDVCNTTFLDLSWDEDQVSREYGCMTPIKTGKQRELDYALIRVSTLVGEQGRRAVQPLAISMRDVNLGDELRIIHHAECRKKQISLACHVTQGARPGRRPTKGAAGLSDFAHDCDTEGGSSGAPVFGVDGTLVGLHRAGHENAGSNQCDGQNKAVHIKRILEDIKLTQPNIYQEIKATVKGID